MSKVLHYITISIKYKNNKTKYYLERNKIQHKDQLKMNDEDGDVQKGSI